MTTSISSSASNYSSGSASGYVRSGIGGAGNYHKATDLPAAPPVPEEIPRRSAGRFSSGIGGSGNIHDENERATATFHEEIERSRAIQRQPPQMYHTGIGGAGNRMQAPRPVRLSPAALGQADNSGAGQLLRKISKVFGNSTASSATSSKSALTTDR